MLLIIISYCGCCVSCYKDSVFFCNQQSFLEKNDSCFFLLRKVFFDVLEVMVKKEGYGSVVGRPIKCRLLPEEAVEGPVLVPKLAGAVGVFLEEDTYAAVLE